MTFFWSCKIGSGLDKFLRELLAQKKGKFVCLKLMLSVQLNIE